MGVAEALGGTREGALLGDRLERGQMASLDPDESITRHDQFHHYRHFPYRSHKPILQKGVNQSRSWT